MRKYVFALFALAISPMLFGQQIKSRNTTNFDSDWKFSLGDFPKARQSNFSDNNWRTLDVPHDWSIELENDKDAPGGGGVGFFPTGIGWYRKTFDVPKYDPEIRYSVEFDGVYMNSEVWVNDVYLGKYPYGYSTFSYDLTGLLKSTDNVIAVRVDNSKQPNSRWYTGSGIYRHVRLVETAKLHFKKWGIFYYTKSVKNDTAALYLKSSLLNGDTKSIQDIKIRNSIFDQGGKEVTSS